MSKFMYYEATGFIYERDEAGNCTPEVRKYRKVNGIVKAGADLLGRVFRQNTILLPCDYVSVRTYNI